MNPWDVFESHHRSAEVLLRVYALLKPTNGAADDHELMPAVREMLHAKPDEELVLLLNTIFFGIVREQADLSKKFFKNDNLDLLLRQALVAACSALDMFVPSLLNAYLPTVVRVRQRNFVPTDGETKDFFRDFRLKLEDTWPLLEEDSADAHWDLVAQRVLSYAADKTLSNEKGITATLSLVGVLNPWAQIAAKAGEKEQALREKVRNAVTRRNDIVHRGDRPAKDPHGVMTPIDDVWTQNHVSAIKTVAMACCHLADRSLLDLQVGGEPDLRLVSNG